MESGKMPQIPIYACTADSSLVQRENIEEKGMSGYLLKPVEKASLQSLVKSAKGKK